MTAAFSSSRENAATSSGLYVELARLDVAERVANRNITIDDIVAKARRILNPYSLEVKEIPWWSVYEIGQRLTDKFDDVPEEEMATRLPSVFIAGTPATPTVQRRVRA